MNIELSTRKDIHLKQLALVSTTHVFCHPQTQNGAWLLNARLVWFSPLSILIVIQCSPSKHLRHLHILVFGIVVSCWKFKCKSKLPVSIICFFDNSPFSFLGMSYIVLSSIQSVTKWEIQWNFEVSDKCVKFWRNRW